MGDNLPRTCGPSGISATTGLSRPTPAGPTSGRTFLAAFVGLLAPEHGDLNEDSDRSYRVEPVSDVGARDGGGADDRCSAWGGIGRARAWADRCRRWRARGLHRGTVHRPFLEAATITRDPPASATAAGANLREQPSTRAERTACRDNRIGTARLCSACVRHATGPAPGLKPLGFQPSLEGCAQ
jgi:hypothetical protein